MSPTRAALRRQSLMSVHATLIHQHRRAWQRCNAAIDEAANDAARTFDLVREGAGACTGDAGDMHRPSVLSPKLFRAALACIPPDLHGLQWKRVGIALKAELGEAGFEFFDAWARGGEAYNPAATRNAWRSFIEDDASHVRAFFSLAETFGFKWTDAVDTAKLLAACEAAENTLAHISRIASALEAYAEAAHRLDLHVKG